MSGIHVPSIQRAAESRVYAGLVTAFLAHGKETPTLLQAFIDEAPELSRGHATRALLLTIAARGELVMAARESAALALRLAKHAPKSELAFARAANAAAGGNWWAAIDHLEKALAADPADSLAAKMSHALRFMLGDKPGMLRSIHRVLRNLPAGHPHHGFLLGCQAFALEEGGFYEQAEQIGRRGLEREPRDAWGLHAVSHVHEMTGRPDDGIAWITGNEQRFGHCNNFGGHLFWHLALFKLDKGAVGEVFELYDRKIRHDGTDDFRDIANGASLLMRLELEGHDVGTRWDELADKAEARVNDRSLVFADLHYLMALIGAGRNEAAEILARSIGREPARHDAQTPVADRAGRAMAEGLVLFSRGEMAEASEKLLSARQQRVWIGGSDAQRDVFEQVLIEATLAAGNSGAAGAILEERLAGRSGCNRFAQTRLSRLMRPGPQRQGRLGLAAALAFAAPAH